MLRPAFTCCAAAIALVVTFAQPATATTAKAPSGAARGSCVGIVTSATAVQGQPGAVAAEVAFVRDTLPFAFPGFTNRGGAVKLLAEVEGASVGECRQAWFRRLLDGPGR